MARRAASRSEPVDGLILLNKPAGLTSNQALQRVKRLLNARKGGHTGALDPAATGMLPLCFGEATKVCAFLLDADKTYRVTARLGIATDTGDADGIETAAADVPRLRGEQWDAELQSFVGDSMQVPPMYSALKQQGKRLYELARQGETVERAPRPIRIERIELIEAAGNRLVFRVCCSKGTYIRTLVENLAERVGTVAHTARLHREQVGPFAARDMVEMQSLEALADAGTAALRARLVGPDRALSGLPEARIGAAATERFRSGQAVGLETAGISGMTRVYAVSGEFVGVGEVSETGAMRPRRVFVGARGNS